LYKLLKNILQIKDFYSESSPNLVKEKVLCLGQFENTEWNQSDDVIGGITSYLENVRLRHKSDTFWMVEPVTIP
jgi:hypothetical protein